MATRAQALIIIQGLTLSLVSPCGAGAKKFSSSASCFAVAFWSARTLAFTSLSSSRARSACIWSLAACSAAACACANKTFAGMGAGAGAFARAAVALIQLDTFPEIFFAIVVTLCELV